MSHGSPFVFLAMCLQFSAWTAVEVLATERVTKGLVVSYDFSDTTGNLIRDRSGYGRPLNLRIDDLQPVRRIAKGGLQIRRPVRIHSVGPARKVVEAIQRSGQLTIEAWIQPANRSQEGPARIVSLSRNSSERNATLGQQGDRFDVRLRTSQTSKNGIPSTTTAESSAGTRLTHLVFTRERGGRVRTFVNGELNVETEVAGSLTNWSPDYKLALADEFGGGRLWKGTYYLVAFYARSLTGEEISQNHRAGPRADAAGNATTGLEDRFATRIAPILAEHCLECHDGPTRKGGLDLSRKTLAFTGGESGAAVVPGNIDASLLWDYVVADDMPLDRPPLSADQKGLLKNWIADGAQWTLDYVDPALFAHGAHRSQHWVQRLTLEEYIATVRDTVGVDIADVARDLLPKDLRADGFSNTAYNLNVDFQHVEAYARLAELIVAQMEVAEFASRFSKSKRFTDKDMGALIERMGKWIFRGPLEEHEVIAYRGISTTVASAGGDFVEAAGLIIEAMLQSPRFVYRVEQQVGDGTAWPASEYELASRLSYIVWGSSPDHELYRAAESGELFDPDAFDAQLTRMLGEPRAEQRAKQFVTQWLNLDGLKNLQPNRERFPDWNPVLASDMRDETLAFFEQVAWTADRPLGDLLNAQVTFVSPRLAEHYRIKADADRPQGKLHRYDLASDPARGGLLTQGSVLTIGGDDASMVTRGLFVLHDLLRGVVKDPPPCVNTNPIPSRPGLTQRMVSSERIQNEACGGCHARFEPLAFGLERFDGLGSYREVDEFGNQLRDDGEVLFPGESDPIEYASSMQLMNLLASSERVQKSLTWKVTQFAMGRPLTVEDAPLVDAIHDEAQRHGGTYRNVISAIAKSDLVQLTHTESNPAEN